MSVSVTMPRLGESVSEGTVTRWLKKEEIPSPAAGVLSSIKVGEDETVEVGSELAIIDEGGEAQTDETKSEESSAPAPAEDKAQEQEAEPEQAEETEQPEAKAEPEAKEEPAGERAAPVEQREEVAKDAESAPQPKQEQAPAQTRDDADEADDDEGGSGPSYVTPLVRRLASEHGVDLNDVHGTGVGGRIRKQDVLDAASRGKSSTPQQSRPAPAAAKQEQPAAQQAPRPAAAAASVDLSVRGKTEKLSRLRTIIAQRMVESLQISAQLTTVLEVDLTKIARLRDRAKEEFEAREGVKLSYLPFFALATCEALREHPAVNSSIDVEAGTATYHDAVHLGIAVDTPRGLLVPVIRDASDLNLPGLARKIADLAERTRGNHITPDELGGGTFTLTNTGSRGALFDTPIINQPQVGILGTGGVVKRPVVVDDPDVGEVIAVRHMVYLALTYDHRMVDGADAARFLVSVKSRLEEGEFEAQLGL